jgi:hypothetical protein
MRQCLLDRVSDLVIQNGLTESLKPTDIRWLLMPMFKLHNKSNIIFLSTEQGLDAYINRECSVPEMCSGYRSSCYLHAWFSHALVDVMQMKVFVVLPSIFQIIIIHIKL